MIVRIYVCICVHVAANRVSGIRLNPWQKSAKKHLKITAMLKNRRHLAFPGVSSSSYCLAYLLLSLRYLLPVVYVRMMTSSNIYKIYFCSLLRKTLKIVFVGAAMDYPRTSTSFL